MPFAIDDRSGGWLAVADPDQLDQVLWALLDNAVKYGRHQPIEVEISTDPAARPDLDDDRRPRPGRGRRRIGDHLFERFEPGPSGANAEDGSGLGLYVSRELCRAMDGDLVIEPFQPRPGAAFTVSLPGEAPLES